jgi:RND family efflux transporter MFP subunit
VRPGQALTRVERVEWLRLQVHPGFVEAIDEAGVAARVMASVLEVSVREGDAVAAGQVLAVLDDRDARAGLAQAEALLEAARAQALQAQLAFQRSERLLGAEAMTAQEWEQAQAADDAARAQAESASRAVEQARVALSWYRLEAPFSGRVLARAVEPGQLALPGQRLFSLYRDDRLRLRAGVPEQLASELEPGAELAVEFDHLPARTALLVRVLPPADARTGSVTLHLELPPSPDLRPGLLGRVLLPVGTRSALVLPRSAVEHIGQVERVRLAREGRVVIVTVRTGKLRGEAVEILSGLAEGEQVLLP